MTTNLAPNVRRKNKATADCYFASAHRLFNFSGPRQSVSLLTFSLRPLLLCLCCVLIVTGMLAGSVPLGGGQYPTASAQAGSTLNRPADPVVLMGANVPGLIGVVPSDVVAFRNVSGVWEQIPVQVDERAAAVDFGTIYNSTPIGWAAPQYTDPNTFTGTDPDPTLDNDDEIAFMAKDTGGKPDSFSEPAGVVANSGVEITISEPGDSAQVGRVYLFRQDGTLNQGANRQYVNYQFLLDSGDYRNTYNTNSGPNPENSTAATIA